MTEYVAGFMFEVQNASRVALIRKNKPAWQKGRLNGIGGKIEQGETPAEAMAREFQEETGAETSPTYWSNFCVLSGASFRVHFFYTYGEVKELRTTTDEEVVLTSVSDITVKNCIPNLTWLIPMARSMAYDNASCFQISEVEEVFV